MEVAKVAAYINDLFAGEDESLQYARDHSSRQGLPSINIDAHEGKFLQFLVRVCNAKIALEIGTLGGYSGIWIARGLSPDGVLITLEKDEFHAQVAEEHFKNAGLYDNVDIRVGDAHGQIEMLSDKTPFDFIFIDAEKAGYRDYFTWSIDNIRIGGIIAAHNVLAFGQLLDDENTEENIEYMRALNEFAANDRRLLSTIYPAGDGLLIAVKIQ
jgi:caffeoyl-CoA O-methyltransferase